MRSSHTVLPLLIAVPGYCSIALVSGRLSCVLVSFGIELVPNAVSSHELDGPLSPNESRTAHTVRTFFRQKSLPRGP